AISFSMAIGLRTIMTRWKPGKIFSWLGLSFSAMLIAAAPLAAQQDGFNMNLSTADIRTGESVFGQKPPEGWLDNRVVLVEFWGIQCPPCLASMPKLDRIHKELAPMGLVVLGAHVQDAEDQQVREAAARLGVTFPIFTKAKVANGDDFSGIPHCMLFDHTGKCIYRGSPFKVEPLLRQAVANAPAVILEGKTLEKLEVFNSWLRDESQFGKALKKAQGFTDSKDPLTASEATYVVERLTAHGRKLIDQAVQLQKDDPIAAWEMLQRAEASFRGGPIGIEATKMAKQWKKDTAFQKSLRAAQQLSEAQEIVQTIALHAGSTDGTLPPAFIESVPKELRRKLSAMLRTIEEEAPDSKTAKMAQEMAIQWKLAP
ncbi:MAG: TlpA disulfide reductase family protein, partial [Pirellulaceae bacterium]